jgi:hypothetical protein
MTSYNTGPSTICDIKKQKDQLQSFLASSDRVDDLSKQQTLKGPKLAPLGKVLCKWFAAMHSKGKHMMTGSKITAKAMSFDDEMQLTHKCACYEGSNKKLAVRTARTYVGRASAK